jgi:cell division protein FtsI/penicillin-binding protein 2
MQNNKPNFIRTSSPQSAGDQSVRRRLRVLQLAFVLLGFIVAYRLADIQIAQHAHYAALASNEHQRKYTVTASRGQIYLRDGDTPVPLALNQTLKVLYVDPSLISDKEKIAKKLADVTGDDPNDYLNAMEHAKEYVVLKAKIGSDMAQKLKNLNLYGVGLSSQDYRVYPEGNLASQIVGFVNNDGAGQYGIEGYMNDELKGKDGQLNAKTDTNGVPIETTDNLSKPATPGDNIVLTIDRNIQAQAESFLASGVKNVGAESGSVIVMDPKTGAVKAMANYPTFDPNNYGSVKDYSTFENSVVSDQFEPGSGFKIITMAAGLDKGAINPDTTYTDNGCEQVSDHTICNAANHKDGPNTTMTVVLRDSLNTGVMFVLKMLGADPTKINSTGKKTFYDYITNHFLFGRPTGIEQAGEASGTVNKPSSNDVNYANMTFGQGVSVTMLQMAAATSTIANHGTYYKPYLVQEIDKEDGSKVTTTPKVVKSDVISDQAAKDLSGMMQVVVEHGSGYLAKTPGYNIAGKTGTAQIPNPNGLGYLENQNIGTFVGFAPVEDPKFVVMVRINKPHVNGFAESTTVPVFTNLTRWLLQYYAVPPSS